MLAIFTIAALLISNSPLYPIYREILTTPIIVQVGSMGLNKPILLWINDGLMAIFFCLVAIEIKRKVFAAPDISWPQLALPGIGALGGIAVPAMIYMAINANFPEYHLGCAIPAATDITSGWVRSRQGFTSCNTVFISCGLTAMTAMSGMPK